MIRAIQESEVGAERLKFRKKKKRMKKKVIPSLKRKLALANHEIVDLKQSKKHKLHKRMPWRKQNDPKLVRNKLRRKLKNKKRHCLILKMGIKTILLLMNLPL